MGRKQVLTAPPVKQVALAHGTPVFQPRTLRAVQDDTIRALAPEIIVVVAYGCILPASVLLRSRPMAASTCTFRCCRITGSSAPAVVGAERRCGDRRLHYADGRGLDTGAVLGCERSPSTRKRPAASCLTGWRLWVHGAVSETLPAIAQGSPQAVPQQGSPVWPPCSPQRDGTVHV